MHLIQFKSIRNQINLLLITIVLLSISTITAFSIYHVQKQWQIEAEKQMNQQIELMNQEIELYIKSISENTKMLAEIPIIRQVDERITSYVDLSDESGEVEMIPGKDSPFEMEVYEVLRAFQSNHTAVKNASVGVEANGGFIKSPPSPRFNGYDARERSWYQIAMDNPDKITIPGIYETSSLEQVILCVTTIRNVNDQLVGVVTVDFDLKDLSRILEKVSIGQLGYVFVTDPEGKIIAHPKDTELIGQNISELNMSKYLYNDLIVEMKDEISVDGESYIVHSKPSSLASFKFYYFVLINKEEIAGTTRTLISNLIITAMISVALVLFFSQFLSKRISKPITALYKFSEELAAGDLSKRLYVDRSDEIGQLTNHFNIMAEAIEKSKLTLEEKVESRTIELSIANKDLQALNEELNQTLSILKDTQNQLIQSEKLAGLSTMISGLAHEMNTPLGTAVTMGSYLSSMTENLSKRFDEQKISKSYLTDYVHNVSEANTILSRSLKETVELVDEFKRTHSSSMNETKEQLNIMNLIREVIESFKDDFEAFHYHIKLEGPEYLYTYLYGQAFKELLKHLIENTIKYAYEHEGEKIIEIKVFMEDDIVVLTFADYGKGIDDTEAKRLFEPFYTNSRNKGSLGLGLNVVYNTVSYLMRGSIDLEFGLNKGLKYIIRWPQ